MQLNPIKLSRRLYSRAKAWRLRHLGKALVKQRADIELAMTRAAQQAIVNAHNHRIDPGLQDLRRALRADHQLICDRQLVIGLELQQLRAAS